MAGLQLFAKHMTLRPTWEHLEVPGGSLEIVPLCGSSPEFLPEGQIFIPARTLGVQWVSWGKSRVSQRLKAQSTLNEQWVGGLKKQRLPLLKP